MLPLLAVVLAWSGSTGIFDRPVSFMDHGKTVRRHEGHWGIEDEAPPEIEAVPEITTDSVEVSAGELACELCKRR